MSDTAYMLITGFMGLYTGVMVGLSFHHAKSGTVLTPHQPSAQSPKIEPIPLAVPPSAKDYLIKISLN